MRKVIFVLMIIMAVSSCTEKKEKAPAVTIIPQDLQVIFNNKDGSSDTLNLK